MNDDRQPTRLKPLFPPAEFWQALCAFRIYTFACGCDPHFANPDVPLEGSLLHAVDVVDSYLKVAFDEGWIDG